MNEDAHASKKGGTAVKIRPLLETAEGFYIAQHENFHKKRRFLKNFKESPKIFEISLRINLFYTELVLRHKLVLY